MLNRFFIFYAFSIENSFAKKTSNDICEIIINKQIDEAINSLLSGEKISEKNIITILNNFVYFMKKASNETLINDSFNKNSIIRIKKIWHYFYVSYTDEPQNIDPKQFENFEKIKKICGYHFISENLLISDIELNAIKCRNKDTQFLYCPYKEQ